MKKSCISDCLPTLNPFRVFDISLAHYPGFHPGLFTFSRFAAGSRSYVEHPKATPIALKELNVNNPRRQPGAIIITRTTALKELNVDAESNHIIPMI
ncbi:MAG TPA: hypothetical protein VHO46_14145 [Bacteroidales bacterium]|nr:hypothetical protein [Bacteroidales bacterium]